MRETEARARRVTASQLYDLARCEHRVALDFQLDRSQRTPPSEALALLLRRGIALEREIAGGCGYETPSTPAGSDNEAAFHETLDLMRRGERGIYQGVLLSDRALAIPDLLRREEGASDLGEFHYIPGDIKSGLQARTDQVLQVVFSARLLEPIQGRRPDRGFLLLGDGSESVFSVEEVWDSALIAQSRLETIAEGGRETFPFLCEGCSRCRWRGVCLPIFETGGDLSLIAGMTRTRKRLLLRNGVRSVSDVAALDEERMSALADGGVPIDGLHALRMQARALSEGRIIARGHRAPPRRLARRGREHFLVAAFDPLGGGEPFLFGYASRLREGQSFDRVEIRLASDERERRESFEALQSWLGDSDETVNHHGGDAGRAFDRMADVLKLDAARQGRIEARFCDLAPMVRRGAYLPVRRYRFGEVAAAIAGASLPGLERAEGEPFLWFENLRNGNPGDWRRKIEEETHRDLLGLAAIRDWVCAGPTARTEPGIR